MDENDYGYLCSIANPKYQLQEDAYDFVVKKATRIIQLPTIAKLTTDNRSIINDFPIEYDTYGLEPYNEYSIKINDGYDTSLYLFVHFRGSKTYLLPVLVGFQSENSCSPINLTDNWRMRALRETAYVDVVHAKREFGIDGWMLEIDNHDIYGMQLVLASKPKDNFLKLWQRSEGESLRGRNTVTSPSSAALMIQIWLHTICMWRKRCVSRKVKVVYTSGQVEALRSIKDLSSHKQTIIDIGKNLSVYVNDTLTKREFRGYHMRESQRCGHFRHLSSGKVTYIPPTIVHYKKLVPDAALIANGYKPLVYRSIEDFLREKSYLENDVMLILKGKGIRYEREKMFVWLGKKRLDFFLPDKNIAIECQGVQHFYRYGANDTDFEARQKRDADKYEECTANGIRLMYYANPDIPIPRHLEEKYSYTTDLNTLYELIR